MKLNISILIASLIILCVSECLGSSPMIKVTLKGHVLKGYTFDDSESLSGMDFKSAENVNIYVFFGKSEGKFSADTAKLFTTDKNGDFETSIYYPVSETTVRDCKGANNEEYIFEVKNNACIEIPHQVEFIVIDPEYNGDKKEHKEGIANRYIFNTANLDIAQDKDKNLIIEISGILVSV